MAPKSKKILYPSRLLVVLSGIAGIGWLWWVSVNIFSPIPGHEVNLKILGKETKSLLKRKNKFKLDKISTYKYIENLLLLGLEEDAINELKELSYKQPRNITWRTTLASLYHDNNLDSNSFNQINYAISYAPNNLDLIKLNAVIKIGNGEKNSIVNLLKRKIKNTQDTKLKLEMSLLLADIYREVGNDSSAIDLYKSMREFSSNDIRPILALALIKKDRKEINEALKYLREARKLLNKQNKSTVIIDNVSSLWMLNDSRKKGY